MNYAWFEKIAPHLAASPLVLIGFAYGIHWQLMKSGLLRQVNQKLMLAWSGGRLLRCGVFSVDAGGCAL